MQPRFILLAGAGALLISLLGFFAYRTLTLSEELSAARAELARHGAEASGTIQSLEARIASTTKDAAGLTAALSQERKRSGDLEDHADDLADTVKELEKTLETDPELLAKYSKVYFLNENYAPSSLAAIDAAYGFEKERTYEVHADVKRYLEDLLKDAKDDGHELKVASAYRSFTTQAALKSGYRVRYGSGANAFSADQGYSEHQLGTTVDLSTDAVGGSFAGFDRTDAYDWLAKNAWRYGFILSYPKGNSYYQYEPWHWRFVGKSLAERLHEDGNDFYDLDQRAIDAYLGELFD